jgi:hypothetical protein
MRSPTRAVVGLLSSRLLKVLFATLVELAVAANATRDIVEDPGAGAAKVALNVILVVACGGAYNTQLRKDNGYRNSFEQHKTESANSQGRQSLAVT